MDSFLEFLLPQICTPPALFDYHAETKKRELEEHNSSPYLVTVEKDPSNSRKPMPSPSNGARILK